MNNHDINLPPLPKGMILEGIWACPEEELISYRDACIQATVEADRNRRGEPIGYFYPWELDRSLKAYPKGFPGSVAVYAAPQPAETFTHRCANCNSVYQGYGCPSCRLAAPLPDETVNAGWCEGCTPDDCCGCGPYKPAEYGRSEHGVFTTHALITLGKVIAGYQPGEEGWTKYDQQAYDAAMSTLQPLSESDIPAEIV